MTAQRSPLDAVMRLLADAPALPYRELRVSTDVREFLSNTWVTAVNPHLGSALLQAPVVVDPALTGGRREYREDDQVVQAGDMAPAPEGMTVFYSPLAGWLAVADDLAEEMAR